MREKGQVGEFLKQYLADTRTDRVLPASAEVVRTDGAAEFRDGDFAQVCRDFGIQQEFTTRDRPEFNGVAERRIAKIEAAGLAAQIQARQLFANLKIPRGDSLWSLRNLWACHALNCTATRANRGNKSPLETWYGVGQEAHYLSYIQDMSTGSALTS